VINFSRGVYYYLIFIFIFSLTCLAQQQKTEILPKPNFDGKDSSLLSLLKIRRTNRSFDSTEIPPQVLSELLWSADGINDSASGKRTAPSAHNWQTISIYIAEANGLYLYDPKSHSLIQISGKDIRKYTGSQTFVTEAPATFIYVADFGKMDLHSKSMTDKDRIFFASIEAGCISQNVYLYCASEGLNVVVHDLNDRNGLAEQMGVLTPDQKIIITQTVGYPKKEAGK
jgi:nitroreductase